MKKLDKDGSGTIELDEFMALMAEKITERNPEEELKKAFRIYDDDDNGGISFENLKKVAKEMGETISDEEIMDMINLADPRGDQNVTLEDFLSLMR